MAVLKIAYYPEKILKQAGETITSLDNSIKQLISDMLETMYASNGVGLAANQVFSRKKIIVLDVSPEKNTPLVLINPVIKQLSPEYAILDEGCLSFPDIYLKIKRANSVTVEYMDQNWQKQIITGEGLLSQCLQHEIDHINGKTFLEYVSVLKRQLVNKKIQKLANAE